MLVGYSANVCSVFALVQKQSRFLSYSWTNHKLESVLCDDQGFLKGLTRQKTAPRTSIYPSYSETTKYAFELMEFKK